MDLQTHKLALAFQQIAFNFTLYSFILLSIRPGTLYFITADRTCYHPQETVAGLHNMRIKIEHFYDFLEYSDNELEIFYINAS